MNAPRTAAVLAIASLAGLAHAQAQPADSPRPTPVFTPSAPVDAADPGIASARAGDAPLRFSLTGDGSHAFQSDLDNGGDVSVSRAGADFGFDVAVAEGLRIGLDTGFEWSLYDFSGPTTLVPGSADPFDNLYAVRIGPTLIWLVDDNWSVIGNFSARFAGESDTDIDDAITLGGFAGAGYRFSDDFSLNFGVIVSGRLEDDTLFLPVVGFEWDIDDDTHLSLRGTRLTLTRKLNTEWSLGLYGQWEQRDFRLADDNPALPSGVVQDSRVPVGVEVAWSPNPGLRLALTGGAVVWQEFEILNDNGNKVGEDNTDPAPYIGLSAQFRF